MAFSSVSVDVGDFAPFDEDFFWVAVEAGAIVASGSQGASTGFPDFQTLSLAGLNATQAIFSGDSVGYPQFVFWDNIRLNVDGNVPEPGTLALLGLGLFGLGVTRRRNAA